MAERANRLQCDSTTKMDAPTIQPKFLKNRNDLGLVAVGFSGGQVSAGVLQWQDTAEYTDHQEPIGFQSSRWPFGLRG
jgi:hypothetical protein